MKTDSDLKKDVLAELEWDPEINAAAIGVGVKDGVVTVSGHFNTYAEKFAIERALLRGAQQHLGAVLGLDRLPNDA